MSLLSMLAPVAEDLARVDALIRARLDSDVALVRQVAEYIVAAGGKRLRPALLLLASARRAAARRARARLQLAAVVEFIHTATLLHDDVVDESALRRGRNTANAAFGNAAAVLVGDFLYSRAFQMMVEVDDMRVMQVLAEATNTIAEGEVLQLMGSHDPEVDEARYLEVIRRKTAKLFEAAARLGGVLAGAPAAIEERAGRLRHARRHRVPADRRRARLLGRCDAIGKSLGDDLAEGKPTLPLIHGMRCGSPQQAAAGAPRDRRGRARGFRRVLEAIRACGALDYAREAARREAEAAARAHRTPLPASEFKHSLLELASFSVTRSRCTRRMVTLGRGVAQPGRVLRSGRRCRWFKSSHPDHSHVQLPASPSFLIALPGSGGHGLGASPCARRFAWPGSAKKPSAGQPPVDNRPMGRLLVLVVFVVVAVWLIRRALRGPARRPDLQAQPDKQGELVSCAHCGVHLPRGEARRAGGRLYCSEEHAGSGRRPDGRAASVSRAPGARRDERTPESFWTSLRYFNLYRIALAALFFVSSLIYGDALTSARTRIELFRYVCARLPVPRHRAARAAAQRARPLQPAAVAAGRRSTSSPSRC